MQPLTGVEVEQELNVSNCRIITALDFADADTALGFVDTLDPELPRLKVGKQLFTRAGPQFVDAIQQRGFDVFLDLKFFDIPNTVAAALSVAVDMGVWMVNVHAGGGPHMLEAARKAVPPVHEGVGTRLIAVTVLTSMDSAELLAVGVPDVPEQQVRRLGTLAFDHGLDGVVCSPLEVPLIRALANRRFLTVTPGVRPQSTSATPISTAGQAGDDQRRIMTPANAIRAGSDFLVIGRPITRAAQPLAVLRALRAEIDAACQANTELS